MQHSCIIQIFCSQKAEILKSFTVLIFLSPLQKGNENMKKRPAQVIWQDKGKEHAQLDYKNSKVGRGGGCTPHDCYNLPLPLYSQQRGLAASGSSSVPGHHQVKILLVNPPSTTSWKIHISSALEGREHFTLRAPCFYLETINVVTSEIQEESFQWPFATI